MFFRWLLNGTGVRVNTARERVTLHPGIPSSYPQAGGEVSDELGGPILDLDPRPMDNSLRRDRIRHAAGALYKTLYRGRIGEPNRPPMFTPLVPLAPLATE